MIQKIRAYSFIDLLRKAAYVLLRWLDAVFQLFRKLRFYFFTRCWIENIMGTVYISNLCITARIGKNATLYPHTILELAEKSQLTIGHNFTLSYGALIASTYFIKMGNNVMIGEYTSIRDTTHSKDNPLLPYCMQDDKSEKIMIGNNVWIGRGCIVLPGSIIEDGVIVGANSVVKGTLRGNCLYAGNPVKFIKSLTPENQPVRLPEPVGNFS